MILTRRGFLKGLAATAAGVLLPADVAAEPERRVWALDRTMLGGRGERATMVIVDETASADDLGALLRQEMRRQKLAFEEAVFANKAPVLGDPGGGVVETPWFSFDWNERPYRIADVRAVVVIPDGAGLRRVEVPMALQADGRWVADVPIDLVREVRYAKVAGGGATVSLSPRSVPD